jgi:preprotein translocase subunit YajC
MPLASEVFLAATKKSSSSSSLFWIILLLFAVVIYFMFLRPRSQRARQAQQATRNVQVGDEVQTIGGLIGTVVAEEDDRVTLSTGNGTELVFLRQAIGKRLTPPAPDVPDTHPDAEGLTGPPPGFDAPTEAEEPEAK